jgi:hypothetical protein
LRAFAFLLVVILVAVGYFWLALSWNYSTGERAGWVQKFSKKGWLCKTWEGEMTLITMPGAVAEKFAFTVWDDKVAETLNGSMGKRVALHYEEKVGLPTTCFGDTRYYVTKLTPVEDSPLMPGATISVPPPAPSEPATAK